MSLNSIAAGRNVPDEVNVIVEIGKDSEPVKYEVDKPSGELFVDRVLSTPMRYPCNYGYIPQTLGDDGDPLDALVLLPLPLLSGSVIRCRPVGMLRMTDESGGDEKLLVVPAGKIFPAYDFIQSIQQVPASWRNRISHFFEHYKDLEEGKWVKLDGWDDIDAARQSILDACARHKNAA